MPSLPSSHLRRWAHTANAISPTLILVYGGYGADYLNNPIIKNALSASKEEEDEKNIDTIANVNQHTGKQSAPKKKQQQQQSKKNKSSSASSSLPSSSSHQRDNRVSTLALLDTQTGKWSHPQTHGPSPIAREHHSSIALNITSPAPPYIHSHLLIFGGRTNPKVGLCEGWLLDIKTYTWIPLQMDVNKEYARWRHRLFAVGNEIFLSGGTSYNDTTITTMTYDDILKCQITLTPPTLTLLPHSSLPSPLHSHSITSFSSSLYLYGGIHGPTFTHDHTLYTRNIDCNSDWVSQPISLMSCECGDSNTRCIRQCKPQPVFSHNLILVRNHLLVIGGCNSDTIHSLSSIHILHIPSSVWYRPLITFNSTNTLSSTISNENSIDHSFVPTPIVLEALLCKIGVSLIEYEEKIWLVMVGGGGHVFHFNFYFNNTIFMQVLNSDSQKLSLEISEDPSNKKQITS